MQHLLHLTHNDLVRAGAEQFDVYIDALEAAFLAQADGDVVQPLKPYVRREEHVHVADRIIAMPAYVGGAVHSSGMKWIGSKHDNPAVAGVPRANALIILNDPDTNAPVAVLDGTLISTMRTAAASAIAMKHLAVAGPTTMGVLGAGVIGWAQVEAALHVRPTIDAVRVYDLDDRASGAWEERSRAGLTVTRVDSAAAALDGAEIVAACTTASDGYVPAEWLADGSLFLNVSLNDPLPEVVRASDKVVVDSWEQCNRMDKLLHRMTTNGEFSEMELHAELHELVSGAKSGRQDEGERIFFNPMGMAIEDVAAATYLYRLAAHEGLGTRFPLGATAGVTA